jgi:hypothetical protein
MMMTAATATRNPVNVRGSMAKTVSCRPPSGAGSPRGFSEVGVCMWVNDRRWSLGAIVKFATSAGFP